MPNFRFVECIFKLRTVPKMGKFYFDIIASAPTLTSPQTSTLKIQED